VADRFNVSPAWVRRLKQHRRERGGSRGFKIARQYLSQLIQPNATLAEVRECLGESLTLWSICRVLKQLKYSYKKVDPYRRAGPARCRRPSCRLARQAARI
jgi:transposase